MKITNSQLHISQQYWGLEKKQNMFLDRKRLFKPKMSIFCWIDLSLCFKYSQSGLERKHGKFGILCIKLKLLFLIDQCKLAAETCFSYNYILFCFWTQNRPGTRWTFFCPNYWTQVKLKFQQYIFNELSLIFFMKK